MRSTAMKPTLCRFAAYFVPGLPRPTISFMRFSAARTPDYRRWRRGANFIALLSFRAVVTKTLSTFCDQERPDGGTVPRRVARWAGQAGTQGKERHAKSGRILHEHARPD